MDLPIKIKNEIDLQISRENFNSQRYFYFESWFKDQGYDNIGVFFGKEAEGELGHAARFRKYLNDRNVQIKQFAVEEVSFPITGAIDIAEKYYAAEKETTANIEKIASMALAEGDFLTFNAMQWFLNEQIEEENTAKTFLDKAKKVGDDSVGLVLWDSMFQAD